MIDKLLTKLGLKTKSEKNALETSKKSSQEILKNQQRNLLLLIGALCIVAWLVYSLLSKDTKPKPSASTTANFTSPLQTVDTESIVFEKTESKLLENARKNEELQQKIQVLEKNEQIDATESLKQKSFYDKLNEKVSSLEQKLDEIIKQGRGIATTIKGSTLQEIHGVGAEAVALSQSQPHNIQADEFQLTQTDKLADVPLKNPDTYVPAGTFAKAVMIGGADASAATTAQSNPTPMIFKIIENGTLPNHSHSHLKDCVVTAAVVGDISSERGLIRLESLSCVKDNDDILDTPVEGTIFGPEGKNGVRGKPLWREGALLERAATAGALSGFSGALSQKYTTNSISPLGSTQTIDNSDVFKYGAASGASTAMDKLADYNIRRAEQYHPVIQLSAGTVVDIVFLKGFYLDGLKHTQSSEEQTNKPQQTAATNATTNLFGSMYAQNEKNINEQDMQLKPLPLTPNQIERLKAHSRELHFTAQ